MFIFLYAIKISRDCLMTEFFFHHVNYLSCAKRPLIIQINNKIRMFKRYYYFYFIKNDLYRTLMRLKSTFLVIYAQKKWEPLRGEPTIQTFRQLSTYYLPNPIKQSQKSQKFVLCLMKNLCCLSKKKSCSL